MDIKTLYCAGNVENSGNIVSFYSPTYELTRGVWQISLKDLIFDTSLIPNPITKPVGISLNFVKGYKWNTEARRFESTTIPLNFFLLERTSTLKKKRIVFDTTWTTINNLCDQFVVHFTDLETGEPLKISSKFYVLFLLQRIQ
jgi:hypothetical protein